jgi:tRNA-2-methylthio-N6-dimethylallyladenosine synthase
MNEYDSNMVAAMLEEHGFAEIDEPALADLIVVNTCSVRGKAEENLYQRIHALKQLKDARPSMRIAVIGCMAENHGAKILKILRHVDVVAGPDKYRHLIELIAHPALQPRTRKTPLPVFTGFDSTENYGNDYAKLQSPFATHITIQRGCNKRCSYCIVPFTRGQEKYRPVDSILNEVIHAVDKGVKDITLLGQTVNSYRHEADSFANLLTKVSAISGVERVRFMSPHPRHYSQELMQVLMSNPKICRHVHLPLQSGSNAQLLKMRRQYDLEDFLAITGQLRSFDPFYGISTDVIVGFADESEDDFRATLNVMRLVEFDSAFMFTYSPREGTEAFPWKENLSETQKSERLSELIELQNSIILKRNQNMVGRTETLLVERPSSRNPEEFVGITDNFKKVVFPALGRVKLGDLVSVHLTDIRGWTIRGELANL